MQCNFDNDVIGSSMKSSEIIQAERLATVQFPVPCLASLQDPRGCAGLSQPTSRSHEDHQSGERLDTTRRNNGDNFAGLSP